VTRTRFGAAALCAAVLGLTASLAPAASIAAPDATVRPATPSVTWADSADDFAPFAVEDRPDYTPANEWAWTAFDSSPEAGLGDYVDFTAEGVSSNGTTQVALVHGLPAPIEGSALPAVIDDAAIDAGADTMFGLLIASTEQESGFGTLLPALEGLNGAATLWPGREGGSVDTATLAQQLAGDFVVTGYVVVLGGSPLLEESVDPEVPVDPENPPVLLSELLPESVVVDAPVTALRAAAPAEAGVSSLRFGPLTTYFTPQPTAALTLGRSSFTVVQATTTGIPVAATGFAPGETVTVGLSRGFSGDEVPGVTFVADADGAVSGTVVLPSDLATAGELSLVLIGASSGQSAFAAFDLTAGGAPVAVPVPGRATFTG